MRDPSTATGNAAPPRVRVRLTALMVGLAMPFFGWAAPARAEYVSRTYQFQVISPLQDTNATNQAAIEANIWVRVSNGVVLNNMTTWANGGALFEFFVNPDAPAMSITDVYFDDGTLLSIGSAQNGPGVSFTTGSAEPNHLTNGGNLPTPFVVYQNFLADSDSGKGGVQPNGVNRGESLGILFTLKSNQDGSLKTIYDTFAALERGQLLNQFSYPDPDSVPGENLRIGVRIQGLSGGESASAVNLGSPLTAVPGPSVVILLVSGLVPACLLGGRRLLRRGRAAPAR
ncbi:MAG: hypothetical protein L0Z62_20025 [Gemmataceae bacterium]|nr:hypothetical protein [Gemmataceae bacterium]